jgi:type I restriction enzyme S subunit
MEALPQNWQWNTVEELAAAEPRSIVDGPFGSKLKSAHYTDEGPRVIRLQNIGDGEFIDAKAHISKEHFATLKNHRIHAGDLVIAALGSDPPRACLIPESVGPAIVKADCIRFKPAPEHSVKYLMYALNSPGVRKRTKAIVHGVGRPRLNQKEIKAIELPVAPPDEQRRIVARIEELLSRLDAGVAASRHAKAQLQRYRQSVLSAAVTGQLTQAWREQHPDAEPAEELLERILEQRRQQWNGRGKYKEPSPPTSSLNRELPHTWTTASVAQLGEVVTGSTPSKERADFYGGEFPFFKPTDLNAGYFVREAREHLSESGAEHSRRIPAMSVLVTCIGATIGKTGLSRVEGTTNQQINTLTPVAELSSEFVFWFFQSPDGQRGVIDNSSSTTLPILNKGRFSELPVPLPPLAEQQQIVAEVEARTTAIDHLEAELDRQITRSNRLRQSALAAAFSGSLLNP